VFTLGFSLHSSSPLDLSLNSTQFICHLAMSKDESNLLELSTSSRVEEGLTFLDETTLLCRHFGLRAIILGDSGISNKPQNSTRILSGTNESKRSEALRERYRFAPDEMKVYQEFSELLSNFEQEEMMEIISDALREAKQLR